MSPSGIPPVEIRIDRLSAGGRGVGTLGGVVWMVEGGVPGDRVLAEPRRVRARLVEARAVEILVPSKIRRAAECPIQSRCGGCPWMVLEEEDQRRWKLRMLTDALERIGGLAGTVPERIVASPLDLHYRNKIEMTLRLVRGQPVVGFHGSGAERGLVDVARCLLQGATGSRVLERAREFFVTGPGRRDPALSTADPPLRLVIRESSLDGRALVALRGPGGPFESAQPFAEHLSAAIPEVSGVVRLIGAPGRRGGTRTVVLSGQPWLLERLAGFVFRLPAAAFSQVNPAAAAAVVTQVLEFASVGSGSRVADLYAGIGVYGIGLAAAGARVVACEADRDAVTCAERAAHDAGVEGYRVVRSDVAAFLRSNEARVSNPEVVIANPPRTGLGRGVAEAIIDLRPERIVVVSCDPPTLARDLRVLADRGYVPRRVVAFDLFPQTAHVESVTLVEPA